MIDLVELAMISHLTKLFDGSVIPEEKIDLLRAVLRSAPSSLNIQAARYVFAASPAAYTEEATGTIRTCRSRRSAGC
jgi:nitroreductase